MDNVRQTIGGYTYDTSEAEFVASAAGSDEDGFHVDAALYRTVDARWFLVMSSDTFTRALSQPMTPAQARHWCERHGVDARIVRFYFDRRPGFRTDEAEAALLQI